MGRRTCWRDVGGGRDLAHPVHAGRSVFVTYELEPAGHQADAALRSTSTNADGSWAPETPYF
jgi:hypothetical protein